VRYAIRIQGVYHREGGCLKHGKRSLDSPRKKQTAGE